MVSINIDVFSIWMFDIMDKGIVIVYDVDNFVWIVVNKYVKIFIINYVSRYNRGFFFVYYFVVCVFKLYFFKSIYYDDSFVRIVSYIYIFIIIFI